MEALPCEEAMTVNEGCPICQGRCCEYGLDDYRGAHRSEAFHTCPYCADGTKPPSTLERLEAWRRGGRGRSVNIEYPCNIGGPGCWEVALYHENGITYAHEVAFLAYDDARGGHAAYVAEAEARGVVFAAGEWDNEPGLEATIVAALDAFDRGVWGKR